MSELSGVELDIAVAKADGLFDKPGFVLHRGIPAFAFPFDYYRPSTDWSQGGPIIERENLSLVASQYEDGEPREWTAFIGAFTHYIDESLPAKHVGPTPLVAAMRAFVASREPS